MGFWIPAILLGGVGASHHYATKELDYITKEAEHPIFGFWWGVTFGIVGGIWLGVTFHSSIVKSLEWTEWLMSLNTSDSKKIPIKNHNPSCVLS